MKIPQKADRKTHKTGLALHTNPQIQNTRISQKKPCKATNTEYKVCKSRLFVYAFRTIIVNCKSCWFVKYVKYNDVLMNMLKNQRKIVIFGLRIIDIGLFWRFGVPDGN